MDVAGFEPQDYDMLTISATMVGFINLKVIVSQIVLHSDMDADIYLIVI